MWWHWTLVNNLLFANCSTLYGRDGNTQVFPTAGQGMANIGWWQCSSTHPLTKPWTLEPADYGRGAFWAGSSNPSNLIDGIGDLRCFYAHLDHRMPFVAATHVDLQNNLYYNFDQPIQVAPRSRLVLQNVHDSLWVEGPLLKHRASRLKLGAIVLP